MSSQIMSQGMMSSSGVTALPFKEGSKAIQSPVVQEEFRQMVAEHKSLVKLGEGYGKWDRTGKLMYIDQMEAIEDRWGIFMKRFELMGEMNPEFVLQVTVPFFSSLRVARS
uniref:Uncharacterized protein n=1 Tax=Guillardia theta (strain CCMP2712) TaxID=905079 RepID=A0A0C3SII1_GUITC